MTLVLPWQSTLQAQDAFDLMNAWADTIGMKDTHFANVHGLDNPNSTLLPMIWLYSAVL